MRCYRIILTIFLLILFFNLSLSKVLALPVGTLLYRSSSNGRLYGLNEEELISIRKGTIKNIYSGHVAIYVGEENGEHIIVEALAGGLQKTPARYFIDSSQGEEFLGAKLPSEASWLQRLKAAEIAKALSEFSLAYDFDFHHQKGPKSGQWTCVGLAEKVYESADIVNPFDISALVYDSANYSVDITSDGFDSYSRYNNRGDCFSRSKEFSLINPYTKMIMPLPEVFGFNVGKQHEEKRYIFLPYTQFLQETLEDVEVDIELSSDFIEEEIRPNYPSLAIALKWSFINQPLSAIKKVGSYLSRNKDIIELERDKNKYVDNSLDKDNNQTNAKNNQNTNPTWNLVKEVLQLEKDKQPSLEEEKLSIKEEERLDSFQLYEVLSGDTFILNSGEKVSYIGIEAPQLKTQGVKEDECLAWVARERNEEILRNQEIILKKDPNLSFNNSGSRLRYVYIKKNGELQLVNEILAKEGLVSLVDYSNSSFYPQNKSIMNKIVQANTQAKNKNLGIYGLVCENKNNKQVEVVSSDLDSKPNDNSSHSLWQKLKSILAKSDNLQDQTKIASSIEPEPKFKNIFTGGKEDSNYSKPETSEGSDNKSDDNNSNKSYYPYANYSQGDNSDSESENNNKAEEEDNDDSNYDSDSDSDSDYNETEVIDDDVLANDENDGETEIEPETEPELINECLSSLVISRIFADGSDDWLEIYNPCHKAIDLQAEGVRLERSVTGEDPFILLRFDVLEDYLFQSSSSELPAYSALKIVRDDANEQLRAEADVIALRDSFTWSESGYSIFLAKDVVSSYNDKDIIDLVGVGSDSLYFEGSGPSKVITENNILTRRALASSTILSMKTGAHKDLPPVYDSNNNSFDFILWPLLNDTEIEEDPQENPPINLETKDKLLSLWHFDECRGTSVFDSINNSNNLNFDWQWVKGQAGCALKSYYNNEALLIPLNNNFSANDFSLSWQQKIKDNGRLVLSLQNSSDENFVLTLGGYYVETKTPFESQIRHDDSNIKTDNAWHNMFFNLNLNPPTFNVYEDDNLVLSRDLGQRLEDFDTLSIKAENGYSSLDQLGIFSPSLTNQEKINLSYPLQPYSLPEREALSLKHYWNFDEGQGSVAVDSVSASNISLEPSLWANGLNDFALELDKATPELFVDLPAFSNDSVAITFWYKNTSGENTGRFYLTLQDEFNDILGLRMSAYLTEINLSGVEYRLEEADLPLDDLWHEIAFIYNAYDYNLKIIIDGQEKYSRDLPWLSSRPSKLKIRRDNFYFLLDELKIWQGDVKFSSLQ